MNGTHLPVEKVGIALFVVGIFIIFGVSCTSPTAPAPINRPLYLSIDGGSTGSAIWTLDADSFEIIDSLGNQFGTPKYIELSSNYLFAVFSKYRGDYTFAISLAQFSTAPLQLLNQVFPKGGELVINSSGDLLIMHGGSNLYIHDSSTLGLIYQDTTLDYIYTTVPSTKANQLVCAISYGRVMIYDLDEYAPVAMIPLVDSLRMPHTVPVDIALSPDEEQAYITVYNWTGGGGGFGSLIVLDLVTKTVLSEFTCGSFSQLGVSPDGKYVYVTDPAGGLYIMPPTNQLLRYSVAHDELEVFIDGSADIGLGYGNFITNEIVVGPNSETLFISSPGIEHKNEGIHIIKLSVSNKEVINTFALPKDERGYNTQMIRQIKLGGF